MWSIAQLAYLAGIIDGEGTMYIQRRMDNGSWTYWPRFQICNTNADLMNWVHQTFGGLIYKKERNHIKSHWKAQIQWYSKISIMDQLLPLIYPYLINKKPHAEIMMEFRKTFANKSKQKLPKEVQYFREECLNKIRNLNHR